MTYLKPAAATLVVLIGISVVGCSSNRTSDAAPLSSGQTTTSPAASASVTSADPIEGEWHQTFTCEAQVRTFQRKLASWVRQGLPGGEDAKLSLAALSKKYTRLRMGPQRKDRDHSHARRPVQGSTGADRIIRFQAGSLVILNVWDQDVEMDARYWMVGAHTFAANDGNGDLGGTPRFTFHLHGDRMTFKRVGEAGSVGRHLLRDGSVRQGLVTSDGQTEADCRSASLPGRLLSGRVRFGREHGRGAELECDHRLAWWVHDWRPNASRSL